MNPDEVLAEVLARIGGAPGKPVFIGRQELESWPGVAVHALKNAQVLVQAGPATSAQCPGCEQACTLPVQVRSDRSGPRAFVVCEERCDTSWVEIPPAHLERCLVSLDGLARALARLLSIPPAGASPREGNILDVGLLRGGKHSSHVQLQTAGQMTLLLAGHSVPLLEVLRMDGGVVTVDQQALYRLVDAPVGPAGSAESADSRQSRLKRWVVEERAKGTKAFLQVVATREGISPQRLKQILDRNPGAKKAKPRE